MADPPSAAELRSAVVHACRKMARNGTRHRGRGRNGLSTAAINAIVADFLLLVHGVRVAVLLDSAHGDLGSLGSLSPDQCGNQGLVDGPRPAEDLETGCVARAVMGLLDALEQQWRGVFGSLGVLLLNASDRARSHSDTLVIHWQTALHFFRRPLFDSTTPELTATTPPGVQESGGTTATSTVDVTEAAPRCNTDTVAAAAISPQPLSPAHPLRLTFVDASIAASAPRRCTPAASCRILRFLASLREKLVKVMAPQPAIVCTSSNQTLPAGASPGMPENTRSNGRVGVDAAEAGAFVVLLSRGVVAAAVPRGLLPTVAGWLLCYPVLYCLDEAPAHMPPPAPIPSHAGNGEAREQGTPVQSAPTTLRSAVLESSPAADEPCAENCLGMVPLTIHRLSVCCATLRQPHAGANTRTKVSATAAAAAPGTDKSSHKGCRIPLMQFSVPASHDSDKSSLVFTRESAAALDLLAALRRAVDRSGGAFSSLQWDEEKGVSLPYVAL